ncbi:lactonase family protein [Pelobium sp.]|nr:lactonase family protein [Pelobium sp.]MDA9555190.1 lactonase family protein [Pelobium sp.]
MKISYKNLLTLLLFVSFTSLSFAQKTSKNRFYHLIIGTYTKTQDKGLFVYKFDTQTGKLTFESSTEGIKNPSYLAINSNGTKVYSVNESGTERKGGVSAFNFDAKTGKISFINEQDTKGSGPCYIRIAKDNKYIFTANYTGGSISALPLNKDGSIAPLQQLIQHEGSSINPNRQKEPHAHSAIFSPAGDILYSADLGTDKLYAYTYQPENKEPLSDAKQAFVNIEPGYGPRHFDFNKSGNKLYLVAELTAMISVFDVQNKTLKNIQNISMNANDFKGINGAADIHLSNDGNFLYATNRGSVNEIVIFKVDKPTGKLTKIGAESSKGKMPRNFMIDPTDQFLLVANQNSDDIYVFRRDKKTGLLSYINEKLTIGNPVCLKMTPAK